MSDGAVIQAPNQTPGRRFQPTVERSLDPELVLVASRWRGGPGAERLLLSECALPFGIPDLLAVAFNDVAFQARLDSGLPPFTSAMDVRLLAQCAGRGRRRDSLVSELGVSSAHGSRIISRLVGLGALREEEGLLKSSPVLRPIGRVLALEAKVSDWRSGLDQCLRYGVHADGVTLVLGRLPQSVDELVTAARVHGVGVFNSGRLLVRPRTQRHRLADRLLASEYLIAGLGST